MNKRAPATKKIEDEYTFPPEGLVNHKVQVVARGCLTLKLSASWKTVVMVSSLSAEGCATWSLFALWSTFPPSGEIGMVSRGTGEVGFAAAAAMMRRG